MESLEDLVHAFRHCTLPKPTWTHATHLRVGAWHVHHLGEADALPALRQGIRRLNESHGVANTESTGYHETITVAYVRIIAAFLASFDAAVSLDERVRELVRGPVGDRELPFRFWSREVLFSSQARLGWVEPDLGPLDLTLLLRAGR